MSANARTQHKEKALVGRATEVTRSELAQADASVMISLTKSINLSTNKEVSLGATQSGREESVKSQRNKEEGVFRVKSKT